MSFVGQKIEITSDDFGSLVVNNCLLVDKTRMIKEFLEGQNVSLITRPRRFGKTLNLSMLQHFFAPTVAGKKTAGLFNAFAIAREDDGRWMEYQGQHPVIFVSFKDVKESSYESTVEKIRHLIKNLCMEHIDSLALITEPAYKDLFNQYLNGLTNDPSLETSLHFLSKFLSTAAGKNTIILIDEYDTPLTHAYQHGFLDEISGFMRNMFSAALKSNAYLKKGLMTGILRVSKNELLSGLNNLKVYTLLDEKYSSYFGFTEPEVNELINHIGMSHDLEDIKRFYNGYRMGETVIYNPWSLMNYMDEKRLVPYWVLTSGDGLLKQLFTEANGETKEQFACLMKGEHTQAHISLRISYTELMEDPEALWTLLLFCGYLTFTEKTNDDEGFSCQLKIPNREVLSQYNSIFKQWLSQTLGHKRYQTFMASLLAGDVPKFTQLLGEYLMQALSFRDVVGNAKAEHFYHGFVAALIASVRETHWVDSNKESGHGLYDVMLTPKVGHGTRGIILEFKHVKKSESLEEATEAALAQINASAYDTVFARYEHITHVLKVGLAFSGKATRSAYQEETLVTHEHSRLTWTEEFLPDQM